MDPSFCDDPGGDDDEEDFFGQAALDGGEDFEIGDESSDDGGRLVKLPENGSPDAQCRSCKNYDARIFIRRLRIEVLCEHCERRNVFFYPVQRSIGKFELLPANHWPLQIVSFVMSGEGPLPVPMVNVVTQLSSSIPLQRELSEQDPLHNFFTFAEAVESLLSGKSGPKSSAATDPTTPPLPATSRAPPEPMPAEPPIKPVEMPPTRKNRRRHRSGKATKTPPVEAAPLSSPDEHRTRNISPKPTLLTPVHSQDGARWTSAETVEESARALWDEDGGEGHGAD